MAGFLVVAGVDLIVTSMQERKRDVRGEAVRAFDNTMLDGTDAGKRAWDVELYSMPIADADAFRALVVGTGPVEAYGEGIRKTVGAPGLYRLEIQSAELGPDRSGPFDDWTNYGEVLRFSLEEK